MTNITTKSISKSAKINESSSIGDYCVISDHVVIGKDCQIGNNVIIHDGTIVGDSVRIDDNTIIGKYPMRAANSAVTKDQELPSAEIGDGSIIGTNVVIYRGCKIANNVLIADLSTVRENVTVGEKTIVGRGVAIENFCNIGKYVKLETNVYITAYSEIEDRVFIAPCVATSNDNFIGRTEERFKHFKGITVKKGARIGVNATILPGIVINEDALVAAGALVTTDVKAGAIVAGVPAKYFRDVPEEQLLKNQGWKD